MIRCKTCVMPNTRPDVPFTDGECQACINHRNRPDIDWDARKQALIDLLDRHDGRVLVPSSGGKDSTYQVMTMIGLGADVTIITARTCHLTPIGRANIDNLARYARTIEVVPNQTVRAKLNRLGLELVGDISWPEHVSIFTAPFNIASRLRIPLIFFGENPQNQYGGPLGSEEAWQMTTRWRSEFGGFLGLRPDDMVGQMGITATDMMDYKIDDPGSNSTAYFLGQFISWDSHRNAEVAIGGGMQYQLPCEANWWPWENLDNLDTFWHDHGMYRKYGYGRLCTQISVDIRNGLIARDEAMEAVRSRDGMMVDHYMGLPVSLTAERIGMTQQQFMQAMDKFTNWNLFSSAQNGRPILKEEECLPSA